ncbi:MAG: putative quinol monooxygenase [Candidatus Competibacter sp.]
MSQSTTIHVVARIVAKPEAVTQLQAVLAALLEPTRQEAGCHRYTLLQNRQDPTDFTFVEEWASDTAIDAHMKTRPHSGGLRSGRGFVGRRAGYSTVRSGRVVAANILAG